MVFEKVRDIMVEQMGCDEDEITLETTADDVGADSLDLVEFIMTIEDEFDLEVPDAVAASFSTVGEVVEFIKENS